MEMKDMLLVIPAIGVIGLILALVISRRPAKRTEKQQAEVISWPRENRVRRDKAGRPMSAPVKTTTAANAARRDEDDLMHPLNPLNPVSPVYHPEVYSSPSSDYCSPSSSSDASSSSCDSGSSGGSD